MVFSDNQLITLSSRDGIKNNGTYLSDMVFNFKGILKDENNKIGKNSKRKFIHFNTTAQNNKIKFKFKSIQLSFFLILIHQLILKASNITTITLLLEITLLIF